MSKKRRKKRREDRNTQRKPSRSTSKRITADQVFRVFLQNPLAHLVPKNIGQKLGADNPKDRTDINTALKQLYFEGKIIRSGQGGYVVNTTSEYIKGKIVLLNRRKAKLIPEEAQEKDIIISTKSLGYALNDDLVNVFLFPDKKGSEEREGEVVDVIKRNITTLVGVVQAGKGFSFVISDSKKIYFDVFVSEKNDAKAKQGDKVIVEVTKWPSKPNSNPEGKIIEVLGKAGEHSAEMHSIIAEFSLPTAFPKAVMDEADKISEKIPQQEVESRRDLRKVTTFTIDPEDAKDFDDAISYQKLKNGNTEIGVHIADVSHYIKPGSKLEEEALERATSVYLVDRVIPMLPEKLSNVLCSLRPNEDKLTFSAIFEFDDANKIKNQWFGRTIIHSDRRFTYEEAQLVIETEEGDYAEEIKHLNSIAYFLRDERFKNGSIGFESAEVKFKLDENAKPISVYTKERQDAHKLIEDFMLLANKKVAEYVYFKNGGKENNTMVFRTHDAPDMDRLGQFSSFAKKFGHDVRFSESNIASQLNKLSEEIEGKPEGKVLQDLAIRSMSKAIYTTETLGHFGLAFAHYSHFTSPIRRYPDMMVHRLLQHYLDDGKQLKASEWEEKCKHSSEREKRAADAERASIKFKQVEYMQDLIGEEFKGFVSGVTEWGIYVEIPETNCEGMIRIADMKDDYYVFDEKNLCVIGKRKKTKIAFGDPIEVEVKRANIFDRTIDLLRVDNSWKE